MAVMSISRHHELQPHLISDSDLQMLAPCSHSRTACDGMEMCTHLPTAMILSSTRKFDSTSLSFLTCTIRDHRLTDCNVPMPSKAIRPAKILLYI